MSVTTSIGKVHVFRLPPGGDLIEELTGFLKDRDIEFGSVRIIGALAKARLGAYSFDDRKYETFQLDYPVEILDCGGNISILEGEVFAHIHATVAGHEGKAMGGHVFSGCEIKVAECIVQEFSGKPLVREFDESTGLKLWKAES